MPAPNEPATEEEALVVQFFADMGSTYAEMVPAFRRHLADDCVWDNQGLPEVRGTEQILGFLQQLVDQTGLESVGGEVLRIASRGGTVLTQRHEHWTGKDGAVLVESLPVMGTFEVADGKITSWRDYYDSALLANLMAGDA
ncbi:limonene-1,2-epoxide hydrolase family protein [Streptomyces sp. CMB-StM0423]|uniref:limonene-1,2-epoxide hydrolase family protein n=1 Tax=Streptomyces sp. CMB-StM0423 TaxID=2059884 RepID=UPI001F19E3E1|nr:limonene-1,2-epoxide hydrolase family protein [Streptomyces sp. CMB-StM0423]